MIRYKDWTENEQKSSQRSKKTLQKAQDHFIIKGQESKALETKYKEMG